MALTIFLFKVSNIDDPTAKMDNIDEDDDQATSDMATVKFAPEEDIPLLCAKVKFRGIHLWSNNIRIRNRTANFIGRGNTPKKFNFNLATMLVPDDKLLIKFYTFNSKKKRKKLIGVVEIVLEGLIESKYIDLQEELLSDPNNRLTECSVQLKLYYTPPDIDEQMAALGQGENSALVDWKSMFDDEGRHGGHRYRHIHSKHDSRFKRIRSKLIGRTDDADTDSYSDSDFDENATTNKKGQSLDENAQKKMQLNNIELLEKSLGRFIGDPYEMNEWQVIVHIIHARDLPGLNINPYIIVQIDDQKQQTTVQKSSNSPYFGEFFSFDFTLPATKFMEKVIFIKVHDDVRIVSKIKDTTPIAIFRLDVATVYNEKEHSFERKWAQLVNPENIGAQCGHLLVSISVTQHGVPTQNVLTEGGQEDDEFDPAKTLIPAAMPRILLPVQLKVTFFSASELPEMMTDFLATVSKKIFSSNTWEPVDSYVEVSYNTMKATTDTRNGTTPVWGEALYLIGCFPPLIRTMKVTLKDSAAMQRDRIISSFFIDLFLISESNPSIGFLPTLGPTWMFLYGSLREYTISKEQDGLSEGVGESICYKGRILMSIDCHPVNSENTANMSVQKETGIQFPEAHIFPMKRTFILFGCIYDVTMIDKAFGNSSICFELSIGSSGYLNPNELAAAFHKPVSSLTRVYPRIPLDNNKDHFRLPIDLQKPILFTKYTFHDYIYRIALSNRLKRISQHLSERIRDLELKMNSKVSHETLKEEYRKIEQYVHASPCGCGESSGNPQALGTIPVVHATLSELLNCTSTTAKLNNLDINRRKKLLHYLESIKSWISKGADFAGPNRYETIKELNKIARVFERMAVDAQPALPDVFLWMISDSKRVAYARLSPEDLFFNLCQGEKGLYNGRVQTIFLKTPRSTNQPLKSSTNAKVQIYLWLGIEEYERYIFKQMPAGFDMPPLPLQPNLKNIRYNGRTFFELRCHCYKARALLAADATGLSDPFLSITVGNETQTTPVLKQSLCPQWNITLAFQNLIHVGTRETAEEIVGNVVVECYDYDEGGNGPELIGRFSTTAKLDLFDEKAGAQQSLFKWYPFKIGDEQAGELLAVFELVQVNPHTRQADTTCKLEEIEITTEGYPLLNFVTSQVKNKIYQIPILLIPDLKTYEIEIMFWGLREFRTINLQPIQQAEVTIECAGARVTKSIKNVQKYPNFESTTKEANKYVLLVNLPDDDNFWPHLSILCVQTRLFGMKEVVGNLVVTNLQKYVRKPAHSLLKIDQDMAAAVNELSKRISYDFNRVRRSVIDAYEAVQAAGDDDLGKRKLLEFERETARGNQIAITNADSSRQGKGANDEPGEKSNNKNDDSKESDSAQPPSSEAHISESSMALERKKRNDMEKAAGWWHKYYASKAKLKLMQQDTSENDENVFDNVDAYANLFEEQSTTVAKNRSNLWSKFKILLRNPVRAHKLLRELAVQEIEKLTDSNKFNSIFDEIFDAIETDRLKELTLFQTFDIIETELENVYDYEGFIDCIESFPLYKGKGSSRSDEVGAENRIYAKFKGKFCIRQIQEQTSVRELSTDEIKNIPRMSVSPSILNPQLSTGRQLSMDALAKTQDQMLQFDYNKNPITLKCRLYLIKAVLYRGWDQSGKADPFIKIALNNTTIIDDTEGKLQNTLEPVFGKSFEFDVQLPFQNLIRIQLWDWDMTSSNDLIAETKIDIENRWFSCHRATCGLPKRYDSVGYNVWRDTKKPTQILEELCRTVDIDSPVYAPDFQSLKIGDEVFECDPEYIEFIKYATTAGDTIHRKAHHESPDDYKKENTALTALNKWGKTINPKHALVTEHIECRSLFNPAFPDTEQGKLEMWLDFFPMSRPPSSGMTDITPPKPTSYQLRLTVWNTSDVELNDENFLTGEQSSDIYVKAWIIGEKVDAQQTDIHYRSLAGEGNFNWRFVFDFQFLDIEEKVVFEAKDSLFQVGNTLKKIPPRIIIRIYDADFFFADDFLAECILNLKSFKYGAKTSKKCNANILLDPKHKGINLFASKRIAGWWPMIAPLKAGEIRDKNLLGGKLEAEFSLLTAEEAEKNPVGKAREAPQPLDEPNRPKTSFLWFTSPLKVLRYVLWRNYKWTLILTIVIFIVLICLLIGVWTLPSQITTQLTAKIFSGG
ncbi:unnamed protein product [Rotaria socialis]|uniref:C2 domain-containing protein n=1 Tax=Rotaria socialis TaxID=392032 RepID=A0A820B429_9BILA|nr:unnamed protein product [Rotaria socialis]CAF4186409.1 unnamed protein product [Rotaria socialis]